MSINLITAIAINIGILLLVSWVFGGFVIRSLNREKQALEEEIEQLRKNPNKAGSTNKNTSTRTPTVDMFPAMEEMARELREKEERINKLLSIQSNQNNTQTLVNGLDNDDSSTEELLAHLRIMEADQVEMEKIIKELQEDLTRSRYCMEKMEQDMMAGQGQAARIAALEKSERRMRDDNKKLRRELRESGLERQKLTQLRKENERLKRTVKSLASASDKQQATIKNLHNEIERAAQLERHQRDMINDLEKRLREEKENMQDSQKIDAMEEELTNLQEMLKRTLIEKDFIEKHMLELDDSLEKAKETEAALARARKEIETLEKHFPDFEAEPTFPPESAPAEATPKRPVFETDIPELSNIMEDNRLFGSLQEFWITLDTPPINLVSTEGISIPANDDWVHTVIGDNDYSVLLTMSSDLAEMVTQAIFKGDEGQNNDDERKDAMGELGNIVAGTLATELDNDFPVGIPEHINASSANDLLEQSSVIAEMVAVAHEKTIYAALITSGSK